MKIKDKWPDVSVAKIVPLDQSPMGPGYRAAPQVFYFVPQKTWHLVYQGADPLYSTSKDISDPFVLECTEKDPAVRAHDYIKIPYRLGVITAKGENPVSALCHSFSASSRAMPPSRSDRMAAL